MHLPCESLNFPPKIDIKSIIHQTVRVIAVTIAINTANSELISSADTIDIIKVTNNIAIIIPEPIFST